MMIINWAHGAGYAAASAGGWALRAKPSMGFDFDSVSFQSGSGTKTINDQTYQLTESESNYIEQWITEHDPFKTNVDQVYGINGVGQYLGLVDQGQSDSVLNGPPPVGDGWIWNAQTKEWVREKTISEVRDNALREIDLASGRARLNYITDVPGQQATYITKAEQALAYKNSGYTGTVPGYVAAEAAALGISNQEAADLILNTKLSWDSIGQQIEFVRRSCKSAVTNAITIESIQSTLQSALSDLDGI